MYSVNNFHGLAPTGKHIPSAGSITGIARDRTAAAPIGGPVSIDRAAVVRVSRRTAKGAKVHPDGPKTIATIEDAASLRSIEASPLH